MADSKSFAGEHQRNRSDSSNFVEESLGAPKLVPQNVSKDILGDHCKTDRPTPIGREPCGEISQLGGVDVYISKPLDDCLTPSKLLLFLSGATGLHSVNNQIQADMYAKEGFLVILPDMFSNDPLPGSITYQEEKDPTIIEQMKLRIAETAKSFLIDMWLARQTPEKVVPIIQKVVEDAKNRFSDVIKSGGGIYSVGYCFGGRMVLLLCKERPEHLTEVSWNDQARGIEASSVDTSPCFKAGAVCHATQVIKDDFKNIKSPLTFVCVENDQLFPDDIKMYGEEFLKYDKVECEFKSYSGMPHGFAVVGEYEDNDIKSAQTEAYNQVVSWLKQH